MLRIKRVIGACVFLSALVPTVALHAATYYVSTSGSNGNPGTSSQPWRTVAYATSKMVAGDTTYVRGGTYSEGLIRLGRSGTSSAPIKLLNAPGEYPVIKFIDRNKHILLFQNFAGYQKAIAWITLEGFEIRNGYNGIKIYNGQNLTIRRNWIRDSLRHGILGNGTRILIDRNKINHNGNFALCATTPSHCNQDQGIYVHGSYWTITNNIIYDNLGFGIQQNGSGSSAYTSTRHAGPEFAGAANWVISNNTFAYNANRGGIVIWGSRCNNARVENNIFYENSVKSFYSPQGIEFVAMSSTGIVIRNNLAFASGSGGKSFLGSGAAAGVHYTQSGNSVNTTNPRFVNAPASLPSSPNFALASGSPAIDKGLSLSSTKISYPGTTRPKLYAYDIGAYEYYGSSTQLAAPTSLQAVN